MNRFTRISLSISLSITFLGAACGTQVHPQDAFNVVEATIPEMQSAMEQGRLTSRELVRQYLARIARYEDELNALITLQSDALRRADRLDRERARGGTRGPLHGIPVALKDNIHTTELPTTGGALAFDGFFPPYEATLTKNLEDAGAIIIAKTVLTELANWVAGPPMRMPDNYSAIGGYGMNPYDPRPDPRPATADGRPLLTPGGSSSGIGTAANLWAANVGTETSGSIITPANNTMLAAIKPTVGRVSRYGVIPITSDQDTPGPMARSVTDAAILLGAMEGADIDPRDPATGVCEPPPGQDYTPYLNAEGLRGARIGIPRAYFYEPVAIPGTRRFAGGLSLTETQLMDDAIRILRDEGAVIVDPADIPSVVDQNTRNNLLLWNFCVSPKGEDDACSVTLKYGMKRDFNAWLHTLGPTAPVKTLTELRSWNLAHQDANAIRYGQSLLDISDAMDLDADRQRYERDRTKDIALSRTHGIDEVMDTDALDALLFPGTRGANISARAGYPTVTVPFGRISVRPIPSVPDNFHVGPLPMGVSFTGAACSEPKLIEIAYAFEQVTKRRVPPPGVP